MIVRVGDLQQRPQPLSVQEPAKELLHKVQSQVLKDTENYLQTSFEDAFGFVERCPHKRLWTMLGDHALISRDFQQAIKAFVRLNDYNRIQYAKQVRSGLDAMSLKASMSMDRL